MDIVNNITKKKRMYGAGVGGGMQVCGVQGQCKARGLSVSLAGISPQPHHSKPDMRWVVRQEECR